MYTLPVGTKITSPKTTYTITGVLGQGGFGITYSATVVTYIGAVKVKASVALKEHFVKADCLRDKESTSVSCSEPAQQRVSLARRDFLGEARRLSGLSGKNPHIVAVNEVFEANNTAYYVMEMLEGESLRNYVAACGCLSEEEMLSVMTPIVDAVAFLHRNCITHLDIKPQNIMITADDSGELRPVLIDFGLSKHYDENGEATSTINSQGYSEGFAPIEQYKCITTFSPASDVYSLAATMVYCLTGKRLPSAFDLRPETLEAAIPVNISSNLRHTLLRALSMHAEGRQPDATALLTALGRKTTPIAVQTPNDEATVLNATPPKQAQLKPIEAKQKPKGKSKIGVWEIILTLSLAIIVIGGIIYSNKDNFFSSSIKTYNKTTTTPSASNSEDAYVSDTEDSSLPADESSVADALPVDTSTSSGNPSEDIKIQDTKTQTDYRSKYDYVDSFHEGLAGVMKGEKYGFIDKMGYEVVPPVYDYIDAFYEGRAVVMKGGKFGFIDKSGNEVVSLKYDWAGRFSERRAVVEKGFKYGYIDASGNEVIPLEYDYAEIITCGRGKVKKGKEYGYIDKTGTEVIPLRYDDAKTFSEGMAAVKKDGKFGFIDKTGIEVIPFIYNDIWTVFKNGKAHVKKDGEWFDIDKNGNRVD